jgi:multimeric flavodoxin WrbA
MHEAVWPPDTRPHTPLRRDLKYANRLAEIDARTVRLWGLGVAERRLPQHGEKMPLRQHPGTLEDPMEVIAFNGSPRKTWNTSTLLEKALEGAASQGAETKLVHLYDLDFKGCRSCFGCKTKGGPSYGRCAAKDGLTPILKEIESADALVLGSPIYLGMVSGEMKSFMERLIFPFLRYAKDDDPAPTLFPRKIHTGFIYTMGVTEEQMKKLDYRKDVALNGRFLRRVFGSSESLLSFDTYQFDDYSKIDQDRFDPEKKATRRKEQFPLDCRKAFEMGSRLAEGN